MLVLFLLNVLGFYGIFVGLQFKYAEKANQNLDEDRYSGADVLTFQIPLTVPYYSGTQDYERVNGEFEHEGEVYRLLKQKLYRDTLYIVCVKDRESKKINQALTDYVKTFTDKPVNAKQQNTKQLQAFSKDYFSTHISTESQSTGWNNSLIHSNFLTQYRYHGASDISYPPETLSIG